MTSIESKSVTLELPAEKLFVYLSDFNNFQHLMPPQVTNWKSTGDTCSFTIQGMAGIELRMAEKTPFETIRIEAGGVTPIGLTMTVKLAGKGDTTDTRILLDADLNPMMAMMAKAPLQNFVNLLVDKLKELADSGKI